MEEIFKNDRPQFEEKWDSLKLFIQYGMLTDEKFYDRAVKFAFHAKPKVKATAKQSISTIGLDGILYFLGYKDSYLDEQM